MKTTIEWCDYTFNPWSGCSKVSPGRANCYAEVNYSVKMRGVKWGPSGNRIVKAESGWNEPLKWEKQAQQTFINARMTGEKTGPTPPRPRVFCASLADVFEDWQGPMLDAAGNILGIDETGPFEEMVGARVMLGSGMSMPISASKAKVTHRKLTMDDVRARLFRLIDATPNLDWLLLTKRPENIGKMWRGSLHGEELKAEGIRVQGIYHRPNLWLGVSVEDQKRADERIPLLLQTPAAVRFLSCEPLLLGALNLDSLAWPPTFLERSEEHRSMGINWVIIGGESGPSPRPCNIEWIRDIVRQCKAASVPCFVKQLGSRPYDAELFDEEAADNISAQDESGCQLALRDKKGGDMSEWPADLRVREFPK